MDSLGKEKLAMTIRKICCIGLKGGGVPVAALFAAKCPEIRVTFVDTDADRVYQCSLKNFPPFFPGFIDCIRKSHNKNLFFTANAERAINESDAIIISSDTQLKTHGDGKNEVLDTSRIQDTAYLIARCAQSQKLIIECSEMQLNSTECVKKILCGNHLPNAKFTVITNPPFYELGSQIETIGNPECVLIGRDDTAQCHAAVNCLLAIYSRWVKPDNIIISTPFTIELGKLFTTALIAQNVANVVALAPICEKIGGNISEVIECCKGNRKMGYHPSYIPNNVGNITLAILSLVHLFETVKLPELADYWRGVLEILGYSTRHFITRLTVAMHGSIKGRKVALLGFACYKDSCLTSGSIAVDICNCLLEEETLVSVYDPIVDRNQVMEDLIKAGCKLSEDEIRKSLEVSSDPYEAANGCECVIICSNQFDLINVNFEKVFESMMKPAYVMDYGNILTHEKLLKIGFKVLVTGKCVEES